MVEVPLSPSSSSPSSPARGISPGHRSQSLVEITQMRDLFGLPIFLNFIIYLFFRILRYIILLESNLWVLIKRLIIGSKINEYLSGPKSSSPGPTSGTPNSTTPKQHFSLQDKSTYSYNENEQDVEIMTILARKKLHKSDISRETDFMVFHSEFQPFGILENPQWQLYSITLNYAYFVEMPFPSTEYTFKFCDSLNEGLFAEAQRVARVDWTTFEIKSDKWRHFKGEPLSMSPWSLRAGLWNQCTPDTDTDSDSPIPISESIP